jgi:hypothetical protein
MYLSIHDRRVEQVVGQERSAYGSLCGKAGRYSVERAKVANQWVTVQGEHMLNTDTMQLEHHGAMLGVLSRYSYETPWASAWLVATDPTIIRHYAAIFPFLDWVETIPDDLPDAEADARYAEELARRGLDDAQVENVRSGWSVRTPEAEPRAISLYSFEDDGYLTWRW